jgi:hypothetical protein
MAKPSVNEAEFIRLFQELGGNATAKFLGVTPRNVFRRRRFLERQYNLSFAPPAGVTIPIDLHPGRLEIELTNGIILVGSDCHYWPGEVSLMHRVFVRACKEFRPKIVILNGDVLDLGRVSRHPVIGWEKLPAVADEITAGQARLCEIENATFRARKIWNLGNHDARFETYIATHAEELAKIHGVHMKDHFPHWEPAWSVWVNDQVVIKHRWKGGDYATRNNTIKSGKTIVTGHLHTAHVDPWKDYNGRRWGVDTGCLAEPYARAFGYLEDNPRNWQSAFAILTFHDGELLPPELVEKWDDTHFTFRGAIIECR